MSTTSSTGPQNKKKTAFGGFFWGPGNSPDVLRLAYLQVSEPVREKLGCAADIIDFLDAKGFQASFVAGVGVGAILLDEIGKDHVLTINGEDALVIFTIDALGLAAVSHLLIHHQASVQVDCWNLGFGIFFGAGAQEQACGNQRT